MSTTLELKQSAFEIFCPLVKICSEWALLCYCGAPSNNVLTFDLYADLKEAPEFWISNFWQLIQESYKLHVSSSTTTTSTSHATKFWGWCVPLGRAIGWANKAADWRHSSVKATIYSSTKSVRRSCFSIHSSHKSSCRPTVHPSKLDDPTHPTYICEF